MLFCLICPEEGTAEEASINGRLVDNDAVFLVVSGEASHSSNRIGSIWHLIDCNVLRRLGCHKCSLRVIVKVFSSLKAKVGIGGYHAHGLFAHRTLQSILSGLIVICKWDERAADSEHHRWMDLAMSVLELIGEVREVHSDQCVFFLLDIEVLDQSAFDEVAEGCFALQVRGRK